MNNNPTDHLEETAQIASAENTNQLLTNNNPKVIFLEFFYCFTLFSEL